MRLLSRSVACCPGAQGVGQNEVDEGIIYSGSAISVADSKGRFALPLEMRKMVRQSSEGKTTLCLAPHHDLKCAVGFGISHKKWLQADVLEQERVARDKGQPFDLAQEMRRRLTDVEDLNFDDGGRFFVPDDIKEIQGFERAIVFAGVGIHIELWDPKTLLDSGACTPRLRRNVELFLSGGGK